MAVDSNRAPLVDANLPHDVILEGRAEHRAGSAAHGAQRDPSLTKGQLASSKGCLK